MRRATIVAWASAALAIGPASPVAACPPPSFVWQAPAALPPDPTVYLVPWWAIGPVDDFLLACDDELRPPPPAPPPAPPPPRATDPDDPWDVAYPPTPPEPPPPPLAPGWQPSALGLYVRDRDGRPVASTAQRRSLAIGDIVAVRLAIRAGTVALDYGPDGVAADLDLSATSSDGLREHRIGAHAAPVWTIARATVERDASAGRLAVGRDPCVHVHLQGAGVALWLLDSPRCVQRLLLPSDVGAATWAVAPRCLDDDGALLVEAAYVDGTTVRYRVATGLTRHRSRAPFDLTAALLAAVWLTRRRRLHLVAPPIG